MINDMKIPILPLTLLMAAAFPLLPHSASAAGPVLYVSPEGNDSHSGAAPESPFQTITRARDEVRKIKSGGETGPVTVEILAGTYPLTDSLRFEKQDSGTEAGRITYRAKDAGTVKLTGARILKPADFRPVSDPQMVERLDPAARGHVVSLDLANFNHAGPFPAKFDDQGGLFELFDARGRLPLSRWPNDGRTTIGKVIEPGDKNTPGIFEYIDDRPARWSKNENIWLKGQWRVGWEDPALQVGSIDPKTRTMTFAKGLHGGIGSKYHRPQGSGKEPWHAINLVEEIDQPGEWAVDFSTNTLFIWPRDPGSELVITQLDAPLIDVRDASDLTFEGLVLEHSLGDGIVMENVSRCQVLGCTIRDLAGRGVVIHGTESGVRSCDIHHIGKGAVTISGGDRKTLTKSGNFVLNNHLHHYGVLKNQYSAGVHVGATDNPSGQNAVRDAVGIRVANNAIHHAPRDAVLYSGNDNVYELNEIYYCGYDTADVGAFYSWLDWTMRGNIIRHNFMHDTVGGVNPDDGASGNTVYGNIFAGPRIGVWIASGPDNVTRHNIFIKEEGSVFGMDDRGSGRGYATNPRLISRVQELNPAEDPWKSAHPEVATMLDNRPELPWRTQFVGNLVISKNPKPSELKMKAELKTNPDILVEKDNVTIPDDPGILAAAHARKPAGPESAPLAQIPGFEPIPFEKLGLQVDEFRLRLPTDEEAARRPEDSPYAKEKDLNFGT